MTGNLLYTILGIDKTTNEHRNRTWNGERVEIEIISMMYTPPNGQTSNRIGVKVDGKNLGVFDSPPALPLGTKAVANIYPVWGATVTANHHNSQFQIGVLKNYDFAEVNFSNTPATITIDFIKNPRPRHPTYNPDSDRLKQAVAKIGDKTIGELKKESIGVLQGLNVYRPGATLDVTLTRAAPYKTVVYLTIDPKTLFMPEERAINQASMSNTSGDASRSDSRLTLRQLIIQATRKLAIRIVKAATWLESQSSVGRTLGNQLLNSGALIGARCIEAQLESSLDETIAKYQIGLKLARETKYWIEIIVESGLVPKHKFDGLSQDNEEVITILMTILKRLKEDK